MARWCITIFRGRSFSLKESANSKFFSWFFLFLWSRSFFSDGFGSEGSWSSRSLFWRGRRWSVVGQKKIPYSRKGLSVFKGKGFYPSTTLYLVPFNVIFLMLSIVKLCGLCLFSWGCLLVSDFLTSKERNNSRSMFLPSNSYSVEWIEFSNEKYCR